MGVLAFILIGTAGAPPAAAAPSPSDVKMTAAYQIDIHENETVDVTVTMEVEGSSPSSYCTKDLTDSMKFEDQPDVTVDVETKDNQCIMTFTGIKIANMNDDASMSIEHKDNKYFFSASDFFEIKDIDSTMSVTFPGKVTKADDNAKVSGNTATWPDLDSLKSISAEGRDSKSSGLLWDSSDSSWTWIIVGALVVIVIVIGGGIAAAVALSNRKKKQLGAPVNIYSQPQVPGQPGYTQPGQPQAPGQPGYTQPGQQSYHPNQQY